MESKVKFEKFTLSKRMKSMLRVDFRRMLKSKLFYILIACALVLPIIMTVMMAMMDGSVSVDPQTGEETVMKGPESTWQNIGTIPGKEAMGGSEVFSMCNINMAFMGISVFICLFISDDFRSGYAKNIFTVRSKKTEYVISKTVVGFVCGALMLIAYFVGAMLGGAISALPFELGDLSVANIVMCMLSKILLMLVFVAIFVLVSVAAKQKAWLSICGSLGAGMLLFMMVSMITPLNSSIVNVALCLAGGILFAIGLGAISCIVLKKTSLV
ncbi:MAG: ABC transporter permease [Clostridia bacterium]|nr:ABC transporter permease [Clostridia bacterium]